MCVAWLIGVGDVWRVAGWIRAYVRLSRVWGVVLPLCCMDERSWVMMRGREAVLGVGMDEHQVQG